MSFLDANALVSCVSLGSTDVTMGRSAWICVVGWLNRFRFGRVAFRFGMHGHSLRIQRLFTQINPDLLAFYSNAWWDGSWYCAGGLQGLPNPQGGPQQSFYVPFAMMTQRHLQPLVLLRQPRIWNLKLCRRTIRT